MSALRKSEEEFIRLHSEDDLRIYVDTLAGHGPQHEAVIEVDRDDDLTSIRTKLDSTRVPRVILILPGNARALREGLEFRVLRRLQREMGLELVIVTSDLGRRAFARENGFRNIFSSLRGYYSGKTLVPDNSEGVPFTDPEEFTPAWSISKWGLMASAVAVALLALLAVLAIPEATVVVHPDAQLLSRDVDVLVEVGGPRLDVTAQRLSGQVVEERIKVSNSIDVQDVPPPPESPGDFPGFQPGTNITLEVRDALRDRMMQQAMAQAIEKLKAQVSGNESMPEASIRTEIISERYDRSIGEVAETLSGSLEIVTTGMAFNNDDFNRLVFALWSQDVPRDYTALGSPDLTPPAVAGVESQHMTLRVKAAGRIQREVDPEAVVAAVRGRSVPEARREAATAGDFARPPEITLWPSWADRAFRVKVTTSTSIASPQTKP